MKILSIDPGKSTGTAYFDTETLEPPVCLEITGGLQGFVDWWCNTSFWWGMDYIFIEDWNVRPNTHKMTPEPDAYKILGYVEGECYNFEMPRLTIGPSEHTDFTKYKLKKKSKIIRLGWGYRSKDDHADSACSVLLVGLKRVQPMVAAKLLKEIAL